MEPLSTKSKDSPWGEITRLHMAANLTCFAYEILFLNEKFEELIALRAEPEKAEKSHRRARGSSAPSPSLSPLRKKYDVLLDLVKPSRSQSASSMTVWN